MEPTDAALAQACLDGRKEAFADLVRRHQGAVYQLALRWSRDRDDAQDLAQEAFVRAYRKLATYKPELSFRNWILSVCANVAKNRFRSEDRRHRAQQTHLEIYPPGAAAPDPRRAALEAALRGLPESVRVPLTLKHVEGLSYEEISAVLGIGVSAAKMRVKRGRDELVRLLDGRKGGQP